MLVTLPLLACRHHVLELITGAAFTASMGASTAPDVLLFKRFRDQWNKIDTKKYLDSFSDDYAAGVVASRRSEILEFFKGVTNVTQRRNDYRELLELAVIFFGDEPSTGVRF